MRTWALKRPRPKQELDQKGLGLKKEMTVRIFFIKGCIAENKKAKAQIRTRPKRLWPKTIVEYKKNSSEKGSSPRKEKAKLLGQAHADKQNKEKKIKWAELLGLAHQDG